MRRRQNYELSLDRQRAGGSQEDSLRGSGRVVGVSEPERSLVAAGARPGLNRHVRCNYLGVLLAHLVLLAHPALRGPHTLSAEQVPRPVVRYQMVEHQKRPCLGLLGADPFQPCALSDRMDGALGWSVQRTAAVSSSVNWRSLWCTREQLWWPPRRREKWPYLT